MTSLGAALHHVELPGISTWEILLALVWALGVCLIPSAWRLFSPLVALVHEVGHATAALYAGHQRISVTVHPGGDGSFGSEGRRGISWATFWGYPVPAMVGAGLFCAALAGWGPLALAGGAVALLWSLFIVRGRFGFLLALGCLSAAALLVWLASPFAAGYMVLLLGAALLAASVRDFLKVRSAGPESAEGDTPSDAHILARNTGIPAGFWLTLFAGAIGASWFGAISAAVPVFLAAS